MRGIELALDAMQLGTFEWEPAAAVYRWSDRCKLLWGFGAEEEVTAESILARVHPDDRPLAAALWQAQPEGPRRYSVEHRILLPDGLIRWVQVAGRTRFVGGGEAGQALRGYGAMRDVTARRRAEQLLHERTVQLKGFVDGAPVPIAIFDRDLRCLAVSQRYAQERRLVAAELIGRTPYEVLAHIPVSWQSVHRRVLGGATEKCDRQLWVQPDGTPAWYRWELRPWYRTPEEVGGLVLFSEEITERVRAQQQLHDSQARLELAVHAGALAVYDRDLTARRVQVDARVRALLGFGPDEAIIDEMFRQCIHPDDRERVDRAMQQILTGGRNSFLNLEYRIVNRADGSIRWLASTGRVLFEDHIRAIGFVEDISARKQAELELATSTDELKRADERKNLYLATLSHELRNPLAPIRTAAHLLASPSLTPERLEWVAQLISRQTAHLSALLEDMLDITRICRGKLLLKKERVRLSDIFGRAIESVRAVIDEKHHQLLVNLPDEPLTVHADPHRLCQVLSKLLDNAAKYTDPGGQIELAVTALDADLTIRVRDNGVGIAPEAIGTIFTARWQSDERAAQPDQRGLGIGLALAEGIVQLHGGTIEARSEGPCRGTELIVRLPMIERERVPTPPAGTR